MARPLRIQAAGLTYHITARGVRRTSIYLDDGDRFRFLAILAKVVQRYALRCHAYCQMTNHYHLAVTTSEANVSRAVRQLNGDYAQWWNRRHERVGHVFQARFNAQIVQDDAYLANVCRYIVLNPVRAGMVGSPELWPWSSYPATAGTARPPQFLDFDRLLAIVAPDDPREGINQFRRYVMEPAAHTQRLPSDAILGDDMFVAQLQPYRSLSREIPRHAGRRSLDTIFVGTVTRAARDAAIVTAYRERFTMSEIGRYLGLHPTTISRVLSAHGVRACEM
jgi:putative transposase